MQPNPKAIIEIAEISGPVIGLYDTSDLKPFEPFAEFKGCVFSSYKRWEKGESILISDNKFGCFGAAYWLLGIERLPRDGLVKFLFEKEGLRTSSRYN